MNIEKIKNKKGLYLKLTELYRDLELLQLKKRCDEDITLRDTRNITITDSDVCQNIYELVINNLIEQIYKYEKELDGIDKNVSYTDSVKNEQILCKHYSSMFLQ